MFSHVKRSIVFIFLTISLFADFDFTDPTTVTGAATPDLSQGGNALYSQVVTSSTGQYVYSVWENSKVIQVARSANYGVAWVNPTTVTGDGVPDLSKSAGGEQSQIPQVAASSTGQYVYAIWELDDGLKDVIQVARSIDYGDNWVDPTTTTGSAGTPDLSDTGGNAHFQQIATSSTGQYVYAVWSREDGAGKDIAQVARSIDYGDNWVDPTTVTGDHAGCLSKDGGNAWVPYVATDSTGQYVYVVWLRQDLAFTEIVQVALSTDYGDNWVNPTSTTGSGGTPDLSDTGAGKDAGLPRVTTNSTGQYVYAVWQRTFGGNNYIQVALSTDYGDNWVNPTTVTGDAVPNLSVNNKSSSNSQIATDSTGRYVYAVWNINDINDYIQIALSSDYGDNWSNPTTVTGDAVPNLSKGPDPAGGDAIEPQIATDSSGQYVYVVWQRTDGVADIIQIAISADYGINWVNPTTVTGAQVPDLSLGQQAVGDGNARYSQVATDSTGEYIYVVWERNNAVNYIIQEANGVISSGPTPGPTIHFPIMFKPKR